MLGSSYRQLTAPGAATTLDQRRTLDIAPTLGKRPLGRRQLGASLIPARPRPSAVRRAVKRLGRRRRKRRRGPVVDQAQRQRPPRRREERRRTPAPWLCSDHCTGQPGHSVPLGIEPARISVAPGSVVTAARQSAARASVRPAQRVSGDGEVQGSPQRRRRPAAESGRRCQLLRAQCPQFRACRRRRKISWPPYRITAAHVVASLARWPRRPTSRPGLAGHRVGRRCPIGAA